LAESPRLQPEDLAPDPRRLTYDPALTNAPEFEIFLRLATEVRSMAPWPVEVVPQGTPDPTAERRRQWCANILAAAGRSEVELGGWQGLFGPLTVIRLSPSVEGAALDPRTAELRLWAGPSQQPVIWFGVKWRWASVKPTPGPQCADVVEKLAEFQRAYPKAKERVLYAEARAKFGRIFTKDDWRQSRRRLTDEYKRRAGDWR
jgi:hypothetical protein